MAVKREQLRPEWFVLNWAAQTDRRLVCAGRIGRKEEKQTWMLSWSNRQASIVTVSGWLGTRTVERDLPPNMREMGEFIELAYSYVISVTVERSVENGK